MVGVAAMGGASRMRPPFNVAGQVPRLTQVLTSGPAMAPRRGAARKVMASDNDPGLFTVRPPRKIDVEPERDCWTTAPSCQLFSQVTAHFQASGGAASPTHAVSPAPASPAGTRVFSLVRALCGSSSGVDGLGLGAAVTHNFAVARVDDSLRTLLAAFRRSEGVR